MTSTTLIANRAAAAPSSPTLKASLSLLMATSFTTLMFVYLDLGQAHLFHELRVFMPQKSRKTANRFLSFGASLWLKLAFVAAAYSFWLRFAWTFLKPFRSRS